MSENSVSISSVFESPTNPRKRYEQIDELAESIRTYGVLQPILVRPVDGRFECVFGHRRLRAAQAAGLDAIPATVKELTDIEVVEAQLVENLQRQDIHPLEEGAAYHELHERLGHSVDEIAAKVGKSRATIYARMQLCSLGGSARQALLDGKLSASVGLLIARIPHEKLQAEALKKVLEPRFGDPLSYRQCAEMVERDYMLRLSEAPFSPKDETLVPEVGACTACSHRTGSQPELFGDIGRPDVCTDTLCFERKRDAAWQQRVAQAKQSGQKVLTKSESKDVFRFGVGSPVYGCEYRDLDEKLYVGVHDTTPRKLAKKAGVELEVALARDEAGNIHELVSRKAVDALARKENRKNAGPAGEAEDDRDEADAKMRAANERLRAKQAIEQASREKADSALFEAVEKKGPNDEVWLALFDYIADVADVERVAIRRGYCDAELATYDGSSAALREAFSAMAAPGRLSLLLEMLLGSGSAVPAELYKTYGIDRKKFEAEAKAEAKLAKRAGAKAKKAKAAPPKAVASKPEKAAGKKQAAKSGVCRKCGCTNERACEGGCSWTDKGHTLCSRCA